MSAWIESHQTLRDHPKTRRLARRCGGIATAVGHLHCLWWWCLDYAPDGDLGRFDSEDIAIAAEWDGEAAEFVAMLVDCGFIDEDGHGLTVHDWYDYAGKLIERREKDRVRKAESRRAPVRRTSSGRPADGARTEPTEPNLPTEPTESRAPARGPVDNSPQPVENLGGEQAHQDLPDIDLVAVVGPIGRLCGVKRIDEALDESTDLNHAIRRYLATVDSLVADHLGELNGKTREAAIRDCRYASLERITTRPKNPAAYLTAAAGNATHLGDLVGDELVETLRRPKRRKP